MQDVDLFIHMAEIAGVFVGFGALIAIRSGERMDAGDIASLRWVMSSAIWVVVAALGPIVLSRFGMAGHGLWAACSPLALALMAVMLVVLGTSPENRSEVVATLATRSRAEIAAVMGSTFWFPTIAVAVALVAIILGLFPAQDEALYLAAVALGVFMSALHLFVLVMWRQPAAG